MESKLEQIAQAVYKARNAKKRTATDEALLELFSLYHGPTAYEIHQLEQKLASQAMDNDDDAKACDYCLKKAQDPDTYYQIKHVKCMEYLPIKPLIPQRVHKCGLEKWEDINAGECKHVACKYWRSKIRNRQPFKKPHLLLHSSEADL